MNNNYKIDEWLIMADEPEIIEDLKYSDKMTNRDKNFNRWSVVGSNKFFPSDNVTIKTSVDSGVYNIKNDRDKGYYLLKKNVFLDELFPLPGNIQDKVLNDTKVFWENREKFKKYGYTYKRGILLHGPPGNGKSSIINLICRELIEKYNGIAIIISSEDDLDNFGTFMHEYFRVIEPDRQLLCIIEDIDGLVKDSYYETLLLNILDGIGQMENCIYLGTTNYPEELKERILNRPSRFDRRYEISLPDEEIREFYFRKKIHPDDIEKIDLKKWIKESEGLSLSHLSDLVKSVFCLDHSFESAIAILKSMEEKLSSQKYNKNSKDKIGFRG